MHEIRKKRRGGGDSLPLLLLLLLLMISIFTSLSNTLLWNTQPAQTNTSSCRFLFLLHKQLHTSINICHINIYYCKIDGGVRLNILKGHDVGAPPSQPSVFMGYWWAMASRRRWLICRRLYISISFCFVHLDLHNHFQNVRVEAMNYSSLCIFDRTKLQFQ